MCHSCLPGMFCFPCPPVTVANFPATLDLNTDPVRNRHSCPRNPPSCPLPLHTGTQPQAQVTSSSHTEQGCRRCSPLLIQQGPLLTGCFTTAGSSCLSCLGWQRTREAPRHLPKKKASSHVMLSRTEASRLTGDLCLFPDGLLPSAPHVRSRSALGPT